MAHISFDKNNLIKELIKIVNFKIGIKLNAKEVFELLSKSESFNSIKENQKNSIRLEFTEVEFIYHELLRSLGYDVKENHYALITNSIKQYCGTCFEQTSIDILMKFTEWLKKNASEYNAQNINGFIDDMYSLYGIIGFAISFSIIDHVNKSIIFSIMSKEKIIPFSYSVQLQDLSKPLIEKEIIDDFDFDKRFINYLNANFEKIDTIHWRNFELLVGQFFKDSGYQVKINKGTKDGGIDLLISDDNGKKTYIQCKRFMKNVGLNIVKELTATIDHNNESVDNGIVFCTHAVTKGAKKFVNDYDIKITYKEREDIKKYLFDESFKA